MLRYNLYTVLVVERICGMEFEKIPYWESQKSLDLRFDCPSHVPDEILLPFATRMYSTVMSIHSRGVIINDLHSGNWMVIRCARLAKDAF